MNAGARLGFLGVGWIGRHRLEAMLATGVVEAVGIADPSAEMREAARPCAPQARRLSTIDELLDLDLDGIVIASPSALHAEQSIRALERGLAVFCQKPLGRNSAEVQQVVEAAKSSNRLLGVDLSYRFTSGMQRIRELIRAGELGRIFAADLVFHNAYGPDKGWFYDPVLSGGGCVMDLGVHLVDLALWVLDFPAVERVESHLLAGGEPLRDVSTQVEDFAVATLTLAGGAVVRLACSWTLAAGKDAEIGASFYGTHGAAALRNVDGSFYALDAQCMRGTTSEALVPIEEDWGGRAAADWASRVAAGNRFDPEAERFVDVAEVLDRIYGR